MRRNKRRNEIGLAYLFIMISQVIFCMFCRLTDAALRGERLLNARHELAERHVQPASTGRAARAARARLPALRARAHPGGETGR